MNTYRSFIAISLPETIQSKLGDFQEGLKRKLSKGVTWVHPKVMHITFQFLGDIEENQVPEILKILQELVQDQTPFEIVVEKLGVFPGAYNPHTLWAGVTEKTPVLKTLYHQLQTKLTSFNIEKEEKEFHAHVTLGRIKQKPPKDAISQIMMQYENRVFGEVHIASLVLFQSLLEPTGPIYTPLGEAQLGKKAEKV